MATIRELPESETIAVVDAHHLKAQSKQPAPTVDPATGAPSALRSFVVNQDPKMVAVPDFLSEMERQHLLDLARGHWSRSLVGTKEADPYAGPSSVNGVRSAVAPTRTSSSCSLRPAQTCVVERLEHRLAALAGLPIEQLEKLVVVRYEPGEEFTIHHDGKFRPITIFVYLNDLAEGEGGDTFFPHLGISFLPRAGCAVMWPNATPEGTEDSRLVHAGRPPTKTVKYGINCFFNCTVARLVDSPEADVPAEDCFTVDLGALADGSPVRDPEALRRLNFDTTPPVRAVPGFATEEEVQHLLALASQGDAPNGVGHPPPALTVLEPGATILLEQIEARLAEVAEFSVAHLAPLRVVRCSTERGYSNRCCGQRAGYICLSEHDDVHFPHLNLRCKMTRGDLLLWPNAVRSQLIDTDFYGGDAAAGTGRSRVVEDLRTLRVHVPLKDGSVAFGVDVSFTDQPICR